MAEVGVQFGAVQVAISPLGMTLGKKPRPLSLRPGPERPHAHLLRGLISHRAGPHGGTGEPLVQGLGPSGLVRRSRVEVILLGPLVTVVAVLARHLAVPVALAL